MRSYRTASALLATALFLTGACSDPDLASDLQTEGDPHVVEVNVYSEGSVFGLTDPSGFGLLLGEAATYCRPGEEYKVNINYCPEARDEIGTPIRGEREVAPITDVVPFSQQFGSAGFWHVRIIFDELLDPSIEEPIEDEMGNIIAWTIADTQPVELSCGGVEVPYDGFYDPSGNWLTFPPGPALVVQAMDFVATSTQDCEISLKEGAITDKDGNGVPSDELGPYTFGIAPLTVYGADPFISGPFTDEEYQAALDEDPAAFDGCDPVPTNAAEAEACLASSGVDPAGYITISLAAPYDIDTIASRITFEDADGTPVPFTVSDFAPDDPTMTPDPINFFIVPDAPLDEETTYVITISSAEGDAITDIGGGELILFDPQSFEVADTNTITFTTGVAE